MFGMIYVFNLCYVYGLKIRHCKIRIYFEKLYVKYVRITDKYLQERHADCSLASPSPLSKQNWPKWFFDPKRCAMF